MHEQPPGNLIRQLLDDQRFAVLATQGGGAPYTSLVAFAVSPDLKLLFFPTRSGTRKFANLEATPQVALLVDNRSNSADDYRKAAALTVIGLTSVTPDEHADGRRALLLSRHPSLLGFLGEPDCRIACVTVTEYRLVTQFEATTLLDPR